jgi:UDP-GlcNAc:undecaprenyl-phosphate GlcNAc-1-phosphate transferase
MTPDYERVLVLLIISTVLSLAATALCRRIAFRFGAVSKPRRDRWSDAPVPLLGGLAIVATTGLIVLVLPATPHNFWILLAGATALALVGLVDDLRPITPYTKLSAQLAAAAAVTALGLRFPLTGVQTLDIVITVVWLVGLSNAFNLLDNMDGLAAGVAAIAGGVKLVLFVMDANWPGAAVAAAFVGACLGFLILNANPARIFMGDAGSLFLGFFVAGLSTIGGVPNSRATISVLIGPLALMLVPIFDTALVTVLRVFAGRPIYRGGRDHVSHRLVTAGLTERHAVLTLYALAALSGAVGIVTRNASRGAGFALFAALGIATLLLGVTLARIKIYSSEEDEPVGGFRFYNPPTITFVRQFVTAGIDGMLVLGAFYGASSLGRLGSGSELLVIEALPLVIAAKMVAFAAFRVNNRVWRHTSSRDLLAIAQASTVGSAIAMLALASAGRLPADFGALFVLDWVLLTGLLATSRLFLRALAEMLKPVPAAAARVLIYGAGGGGVALLQELRNNTAMERIAVAFIDDDPLMQRSRVQGLPVVGGIREIGGAISTLRIDELIVATSKLPASKVDDIKTVCAAANVRVSRFKLSIESMTAIAQVRQIS